MSHQKKKNLFEKRRIRIRKKISGTAERPRLTVCFSHKHIYAQCIDDVQGVTLACVTSLSKELKPKALQSNIAGAKEIGTLIAQKAKAAGLTQVVFDRAGRRYHGRVKELADAARAGGLQF